MNLQCFMGTKLILYSFGFIVGLFFFAVALFVDGVSTLLPVCQSTVATKLMFIC